MPSVGMRRTRVFGVVKGVDGARVLRSGRRLWPESDDSKVKKLHRNEEDWLLNVKNKRNFNAGANVARIVCLEQDDNRMYVEQVVDKSCQLQLGNKESLDDRNEKVSHKMYGLVYSRKRKRQVLEEKFGVGFCRGQRRQKSVDDKKSLAVDESGVGEVNECQLVLVLCVGASHLLSGSCRSFTFADFLFLVLSYLRKKRVSLLQLFKFLMSSPICGVYSSQGVQLLKDTPVDKSGICKIFGTRQPVSLFSVDFSAVPSCFMYMQSSMLLRYRFAPTFNVYCPVNVNVGGIVISDRRDLPEFKASVSEVVNLGFYKRDLTECQALMSDDNHGKKSVAHPSFSSSKLASRIAACRNGVYSRSIQKRRSSIRSRRGRNSPLVTTAMPNGSLVSDLINRRKSGIPFSSIAPNKVAKTTFNCSLKEASCALVCCSVNILIIQPDSCYREEGAVTMLEMSDSGEWVLSVKRDGVTRYSHKAQRVIRPSSLNRFTHNVIWTADDGWKLEFPSRHDWMVFKNLYKECFSRNMHLSPTVKAIPVPGVHEIPGYCDQNDFTYGRPHSYITMKYDEVSRTLAKGTASYDMDTEDEEWLNKFNNEFFGADKLHEHLTPENFELMIDAYEKAYFCFPDDISDEKAAAKFCSELGQEDVIEAVYSYWMNKRKQKRSALVRVFQVQQPRRASLIPKPALRKKRSIKRQGSQCGRVKQPSYLRVEQSAQVEKNALQRVEELNASVKKYLELAMLKRKRAQFLMDNADLATYKASMALKIAKAAEYAESLDAAAHFFD